MKGCVQRRMANWSRTTENVPSAGAFMATLGNRARISFAAACSAYLPIKQDFETFELDRDDDERGRGTDASLLIRRCRGLARAFVSKCARKTATKALCKTIENKFFQRGTTFFGHSDMKNYTIEADVLTEGNGARCPKSASSISATPSFSKATRSNLKSIPTRSASRKPCRSSGTPNEWYRIKARVDVAADGSGVVRAKAWTKGEAEPDKWTHRSAAQARASDGQRPACLASRRRTARVDR